MVRSSTGRVLKRGSLIRVVAPPREVLRQSPTDTRRLFRAMVGRRFKVRAIQQDPKLLKLDVSTFAAPLIGGTKHIVWIDPDYVA